MEHLYDLVLGMVERRYDTTTRDRFAAWLGSVSPTTAHLGVMVTEMALSGTPMGERHLTLLGFGPDGEPRINFVP